MKPYTYKCVSPTITVCVLSLLFKQGQSGLCEAALLLIVSSATFVFQAATVLMIRPWNSFYDFHSNFCSKLYLHEKKKNKDKDNLLWYIIPITIRPGIAEKDV